MIRQSLFVAAAVVLLSLCTVSPGAAILNCTDCSCALRALTSASQTPAPAPAEPRRRCVAALPPVEAVVSRCRIPRRSWRACGSIRTGLPASPRGRCLPASPGGWLSTSEENGLGAVYAGNTGFLLSKATGRLEVPALAFVSKEHLKAGSPMVRCAGRSGRACTLRRPAHGSRPEPAPCWWSTPAPGPCPSISPTPRSRC